MSFNQNWDFPDVEPDGAKAVNSALEYILHESNKIVPLEEGTLQRSGIAESSGLKGTVSYDTPYAIRQHEDRTLSHDHNRQPKYLERTVKNNKDKVREYLKEHLGDAF